jgi:hypothetical protein
MLLVCSISAAAKERYSATEEQVSVLLPPTEAGDRMAIRKLFELYQYSDGAVSEDIDVALGRTIRKHPQLFLEELNRSGRANCERCLPSLVGNTGEELVDRLQAQVKELDKRKNALKAVHQKSLEKLRDKLVRILNEGIREIREIPSYGKE